MYQGRALTFLSRDNEEAKLNLQATCCVGRRAICKVSHFVSISENLRDTDDGIHV